eukprot:711778-Pyramimonas_sp.AAC.1
MSLGTTVRRSRRDDLILVAFVAVALVLVLILVLVVALLVLVVRLSPPSPSSSSSLSPRAPRRTEPTPRRRRCCPHQATVGSGVGSG